MYYIRVTENKESSFKSYVTKTGFNSFGIKHTHWGVYDDDMALFRTEKKAEKAVKYIKDRCVDKTFFNFRIIPYDKVEFEYGDVCVNKKHPKPYKFIAEAIDCTNERDGTEVVIYYKDGQFFVREKKEFEEKFERY